LTNSSGIQINLALAYLRAGQLDAAETNYQALLQASPPVYRGYYGLGEVALERRNTNAAIRYFEDYLSKIEAKSDEAAAVSARLKSLRPDWH
jgi:Tfp pilus assembly protein PilF